MSLTGPFQALQDLADKLAAVPELRAEVQREMSRELTNQTRRTWQERRNPQTGEPWQGTRRPLTNELTGNLRRTARVSLVPHGIVLSLGPGKVFRRGNQAGMVQYGGRVVANAGRSQEQKGKRLASNRATGKGLMVYRTGRGGAGWRSTYVTQHRGNPILPPLGRMPDRWSAALRDASQRVVARWGG